MTDNNYFLIKTLQQNYIELRYFYNNVNTYNLYNYPVCFIIKYSNLDKISVLLSAFFFTDLCSTEHKIYLGKELYKAKISILLNQLYIQS